MKSNKSPNLLSIATFYEVTIESLKAHSESEIIILYFYSSHKRHQMEKKNIESGEFSFVLWLRVFFACNFFIFLIFFSFASMKVCNRKAI